MPSLILKILKFFYCLIIRISHIFPFLSLAFKDLTACVDSTDTDIDDTFLRTFLLGEFLRVRCQDREALRLKKSF